MNKTKFNILRVVIILVIIIVPNIIFAEIINNNGQLQRWIMAISIAGIAGMFNLPIAELIANKYPRWFR